MKNRLLISSITTTLLLLSGCSAFSSHNKAMDPATQANNQHQQLVKKIEQAQGIVMEQGDEINIVLPVNAFFDNDSHEILEKQTPVFKAIAHLIQEKGPATPVTIIGNTNNIDAPSTQANRSEQSAEVIAAYLWSQGINNNQITVKNAASSDPVAYDGTVAGNQANRRVEIRIN